jgi:hypothetical protein
MQSQDWRKVCRGHFILKTQETLYGSGVSPLPESELREVLEFLEQDAPIPNLRDRPG